MKTLQEYFKHLVHLDRYSPRILGNILITKKPRNIIRHTTAYKKYYRLHTYIIGHYNPSVRPSLAWLLTPLMLCALILYVSGETYSLTSTQNDRIWKKFSWQVYLLSEKYFFFFFVFCFDA